MKFKKCHFHLPIDMYHELYHYLTIVDLLHLSTTNKENNIIVTQSWIYKHYKKHYRKIEGGNQFSMIIKNNHLFNVGCNYNRQLGLKHDFYHRPQFYMNKVLTVSCGANHTLILTSHGLYGLGSNSHGQIAALENINYNQLQPIPLQAISIHCGQYHSLVCTQTDIYSFGDNVCCQLGRENTPFSFIPFFKNKMASIVKIACGFYHNVILTTHGCYGFGHNVFNQLGLTNPYYTEPTLMPIKGPFIDVSCGTHHTVIITINGIYSAGANQNGQLGYEHYHQGFYQIHIDEPIRVECGQYHNMVLTKNNDLFVFGDNYYGQLGLFKIENQWHPQPLPLKLTILFIGCGTSHTILYGVKKNKEVIYVFGQNKHGELGLGQFKNKKYFTPQLLTL